MFRGKKTKTPRTPESPMPALAARSSGVAVYDHVHAAPPGGDAPPAGVSLLASAAPVRSHGRGGRPAPERSTLARRSDLGRARSTDPGARLARTRP